MSYVKLYEPLGWIVGSGKYIDDIEEEVQKREKDVKEQIKKLIFKEVLVSGFIIILIMVLLYFALKTSLSNKKES